MDHEDKESKTYLVKIKKYGIVNPEEVLRCILTLNEQMKTHSYIKKYERVINLFREMLAGRGFEASLSERWVKESKNKTRKANEQTEYTPQKVYDCAIFDLAIHAFDIQSRYPKWMERRL
jgi:hypothetical protein